MTIVRFTFFALVFLFSCSSEKISQKEVLLQTLLPPNYSGIVYVIPDEGCDGCINDMAKVAINNVHQNKAYLIFTKAYNKKKLKIKYGYDLFRLKNVYIDTANVFLN